MAQVDELKHDAAKKRKKLEGWGLGNRGLRGEAGGLVSRKGAFRPDEFEGQGRVRVNTNVREVRASGRSSTRTGPFAAPSAGRPTKGGPSGHPCSPGTDARSNALLPKATRH